MRPHVMTADKGLQPNMAARLYAKRDTMQPKLWRLFWMVPGSDSYCMAEGECSAIYYRRLSDAVAGGLRRYGERALAMGF